MDNPCLPVFNLLHKNALLNDKHVAEGNICMPRKREVNACTCHVIKELFNLPPLVLKARAPNDGSAFCIGFSKL